MLAGSSLQDVPPLVKIGIVGCPRPSRSAARPDFPKVRWVSLGANGPHWVPNLTLHCLCTMLVLHALSASGIRVAFALIRAAVAVRVGPWSGQSGVQGSLKRCHIGHNRDVAAQGRVGKTLGDDLVDQRQKPVPIAIGVKDH